MPTPIEPNAPRRLADADLSPRGPVFPSPVSWRDQFLYFFLPDRFSDGGEAARPMFDGTHASDFRAADHAAWMRAGRGFTGGTLAGARSKLDYLAGLGVTALWIGPVWKQRSDLDTYHGYGIQNFLEVDPRFGTRQDLRDLVDEAHERGMYVILDVIYNHTGNNWFYNDLGSARTTMPYHFGEPYPVHGWRDASGNSTGNTAPPDSLETGVWPAEFQDLDVYTRAGQIGRWDTEPWEDPRHPDTEFRRGDFFDLKDLNGRALGFLMDVYRYWIAVSDCDGFRIDTVKHVPFDASRHFCGGIREYTESIGKENFLLLGEVTGGAGMARIYLDVFGRNLDATLDIGDPAARLTGLGKGFLAPGDFFQQFDGYDDLGSHRVVGRYHVSILDDHDMVGRDKRRFAAGNAIPSKDLQVAHTVGVQLTTLGIPCLYYGTEQAFDGSTNYHDTIAEPRDNNGNIPFDDRYLRETMFGGGFGAFRTDGCHFFDAGHPAYLRIAAIAALRNGAGAVGLALRRGRQYPRETSGGGFAFSMPGAGRLFAWSRILLDQEVVIALNPNGTVSDGAHVTVDAGMHRPGAQLRVLYHGHWNEAQLREPPDGSQKLAVQFLNGRATVRVDLPPAGMMILA
ncbi:MAG: alpha-amylase family glycosyl hydrolase [Bryobacteraceae bacterium]